MISFGKAIRCILYLQDVVSRREAYAGQVDMRAEQMMRAAEYAVEMTYKEKSLLNGLTLIVH